MGDKDKEEKEMYQVPAEGRRVHRGSLSEDGEECEEVVAISGERYAFQRIRRAFQRTRRAFQLWSDTDEDLVHK